MCNTKDRLGIPLTPANSINTPQVYTKINTERSHKIINISHAKGKASTAKQTCLGSFQGPEGKNYWKEKSSLGRLPCQLVLKKNFFIIGVYYCLLVTK